MSENIIDRANAFIEQPFPLWENDLTAALVENKWNELKAEGLSGADEYTTAWPISGKKGIDNEKIAISESLEGDTVFLELPQFDSLGDFYEEHGLVLCSEKELISTEALQKIKSAFALFELVPGLNNCICKLVRSIQVLKQDDPKTDTSYSHPKIPFSIFVSVCEDNSPISALRVAESILHEAMHLKLTLLENVVPMIKPNSTELFFSPWREEERPIRGVLHGLFVFRAIGCLYSKLVEGNLLPENIADYCKYRITEIRKEALFLSKFPSINSFSSNGRKFSKELIAGKH